jgi:hypothetical protein
VDDKSFADDHLAEAEKLLGLNVNDLYEQLAEFDQKKGLPADLLRWGRERYKAISKRTRSAVCNSPVVRKIWATEKGNRRAQLVCAIADVIASIVHGGVPAFTVAALIVKEGVDKFCESEWKPANH